MMKPLDVITFILLIVGGLNWGLVGFFDYNLVTMIFGEATTATSVIYDLVGVSALYILWMKLTMGKMDMGMKK